MPLIFNGIDKSDLINFPPFIVSTVYLSDCNFRCPYCHNPDLINNKSNLAQIPEKDVLEFLETRKGWLDGVCITGGEPTLHKGLLEFMRKVKNLGFKVKLDTNGTNPDLLIEIIDQKIVDFIAMDIKAPLQRYKDITQTTVPTDLVSKSISIILSSKINYVFRTTVSPKYHNTADFTNIGKLISGAKQYIIQGARTNGNTLDADFKDTRQFTYKELDELAKRVRPYIKNIKIIEN